MRSLLIAVLGVVGLVGAGCGFSPAAAKDPTAPLEVWTRSNAASAKVYEAIFAAFEQATGIEVDYKAVPIDFDKWIQRRAAARNLPDVLINDTGMLGLYHSQGLVTEIQPTSIAGGTDITDRAWDSARASDGHHYGVPFSAQAMVTLVRRDWREKLGRPVPTTWAELVELATAFTTQDPDGDGQADTYGMLVPGTTDRGYLSWWAASYLWQGGGDILAPTGDGGYRVAVDSAESVAAVRWLRGLFCDSKVIQPGALTTSTADAHPFFETGKAGIYLTGPYNFGRFDKSLGKDRYEVIPTPAGPAGTTVLGEGENVYLMAGSARPDAQRALAEFLISPPAQQIGMRGQPQPVVRLPVNRTVDVHATYQDPRWDLVASSYAEDARPFPNVPNFQPFRQQTAEALNTIFASCTDDVPGELGALATALTAELQAQGMAVP
ncbi:ABC transporter substrate-binding protein [Goodfellowiella coeruleoviolacea]|uniref:ABC transporter substrate-binding protein n=1 Tax=Goodfellowiella coeruleoviolacea TaxID=334858 RepID=UPI0020A2CB55|nr:sugar ABC transporter substrate-binding protein [Goodfellowiella coeruleoviolacea]